MGSARPSVTKKQREQKRREKQAVKAEKRQQRKEQGPDPDIFEEQTRIDVIDVEQDS
jgi:hypothetical protein